MQSDTPRGFGLEETGQSSAQIWSRAQRARSSLYAAWLKSALYGIAAWAVFPDFVTEIAPRVVAVYVPDRPISQPSCARR
jgi:hypothetical protein